MRFGNNISDSDRENGVVGKVHGVHERPPFNSAVYTGSTSKKCYKCDSSQDDACIFHYSPVMPT